MERNRRMKSLFFVAVIPVIMILVPNAYVYASDKDDSKCKFGPGSCGPGSCYARGVEEGKNNDFGDFLAKDPSLLLRNSWNFGKVLCVPR
jgi:hypothetical protein